MRTLFRILSGVIFIVSAVAKLLSADTFELYVFSLGFFNLGLSFLAARVVIAVEFALGLWLISGIKSKISVLSAMGLTATFSLFLLYLILVGSNENCHCFGELVDLSPTQSLIKNLLILTILFFALKSKSYNFKFSAIVVTALFAISAATVVIVSPPDNWRYDSYAQNGFNMDAYQELLEAVPDDIASILASDEEKVICFFSLECEYCRMTAKKLGILRNDWEFAADSIICLFPQTNGETEITPEQFFEETGLYPNEYYTMPALQFVKSVSGYLQTVALLQDATIIKEFGYRDLH